MCQCWYLYITQNKFIGLVAVCKTRSARTQLESGIHSLSQEGETPLDSLRRGQVQVGQVEATFGGRAEAANVRLSKNKMKKRPSAHLDPWTCRGFTRQTVIGRDGS